MKNFLISIRNWTIRILYKGILKPILFLFDPEKMHDGFLSIGHFLGSNRALKAITKFFFSYSNKSLEQNILGIRFKNPIGLAAGFDKDAQMIEICKDVGFGFAEVGSITGEFCEGNPKPRIWRLKKLKSLLVYYGLKNQGAEKISERLQNKKFSLPVGISIAKTNNKETTQLDTAKADYLKAYKAFSNIGDYITINISCPNAFGGEPFTDPNKLQKLLEEIFKIPKTKPIFLKLAPDLSEKVLNEIIAVTDKFKIDGFIIANLTKDREKLELQKHEIPSHVGSISGPPTKDLSDKMIKYVYKKTKGKYIIIGCGGISTAQDAYKKIRLGASLLQLITGMIYEGPQVISEINEGLSRLLKKDGFKNISEAVGKEQITF